MVIVGITENISVSNQPNLRKNVPVFTGDGLTVKPSNQPVLLSVRTHINQPKTRTSTASYKSLTSVIPDFISVSINHGGVEDRVLLFYDPRVV